MSTGNSTDSSSTVCKPPDRNPQPPGFAVPAGAIDSHAHVFEPEGPTPLDPNRSYSPSVATLEQYDALHQTLGVDRGIIVQPSVYGTDNRTSLDAVAASNGRLRAVVVVDQDVDANTLKEYHAAGARGVRVNLLFGSSARLDNLKQLAGTIRSLSLGWHIQMLINVAETEDLYNLVKSLEVPVVFDHMGHMPASLGADNPGFLTMRRLLQEDSCWVKLSGAYRLTARQNTPYHDVDSLAQALVAENPDRLVWGSDWPHPTFDGSMPNDGALLDELARWVPDEQQRNNILVTNAHSLYFAD